MPTRIVRDTTFSRQKYAGELRAELLLGIVRIAEAIAAREGLTVQPVRMTAPVRQFMEGSSIVVPGFLECRLWRKVDQIV